MNRSWLARYRRCAIVLVAVGLSGCSGAPSLSTAPSTAAAPASSRTGAASTEFLSSQHVKENCHANSDGCNCEFRATGRASGPFPGTFSVAGTLTFYENSKPWEFSENFTITSHGKTIEGAISGKGAHPERMGGCVRFGPHEMTYAAGSRKGEARVRFRWPRIMLEHLTKLQ